MRIIPQGSINQNQREFLKEKKNGPNFYMGFRPFNGFHSFMQDFSTKKKPLLYVFWDKGLRDTYLEVKH